MDILDVLQFEEGFRAKPYLCSMGYVTIGIGTKLHNHLGMNPRDFPITVSLKAAQEWLSAEVMLKTVRLSSEKGPTIAKLDVPRTVILTSMAYQLGVSGLLNFKRMWSALDKGDYSTAAEEALDSRWAKQTPNRAKRHAAILSGVSTLEDFYQ